MNLDSIVWSQLDNAVFVKLVLSFLLAPNLCRYWRICKEWNEHVYLQSYIFYTSNSKCKTFKLYWLVAMEMQDSQALTWCLLDWNSQRWYTFLGDGNINALHHNSFLDYAVASMDQGLV